MAEKVLSRSRQQYEAAKRNQATMGQVEKLLTNESNQVLEIARSFERQAVGGFLRSVVPGLIDRYGKVNAAAAMKYYDEQRLAWVNHAGNSTTRNSQRRKAERFAAAKLRSQIYVAQMPEFNPVELSDPIVGYGMARFTEEGFDVMRDQVTSAMTRAVASYNRNTMLYNAALDDAVVGVQRVAEPNACAFCAMVAFGSSKWHAHESRVADYAIHFHSNCRCSIETLYEGDKAIRPDYYSKFEAEYTDATRATSVGGVDSKAVLAYIREKHGRK